MNTPIAELATKKLYTPPELVLHGDLRLLTQAGSNNNLETGANRVCGGANQTNKRC